MLLHNIGIPKHIFNLGRLPWFLTRCISVLIKTLAKTLAVPQMFFAPHHGLMLLPCFVNRLFNFSIYWLPFAIIYIF
jgi:hypothetical protein